LQFLGAWDKPEVRYSAWQHSLIFVNLIP
jgi:hypothetical protein